MVTLDIIKEVPEVELESSGALEEDTGMTGATKEDTGSGRGPSNAPETTQGNAHPTERSTMFLSDDLESGREVNVPGENTLVQEVRSKLEFWYSLDKSSFATRLITQGLTLRFTNKKAVDNLCSRNITARSYTRRNKLVLQTEIESLLKQGVIVRVPNNSLLFPNHIFAIVKPSGKIRIIFDMKELNTFIKLPSLRMFTFDKAHIAFHRFNVACKIDLHNAFWHIPVHKAFQRYLSFKFKGKCYTWCAMPFGLRTAPYLFCKLLKTIINHLRVKYSIPVYFYMDDLLILAMTVEEAIAYINIILSVLANAGLSVNLEKSELTPQPIITFLGVTINLSTKTFTPSQDNIESCITKVVDFLGDKKHNLKQFQSLLGSLNFVAPFIHLGRLNFVPLHCYLPYFSNQSKKITPTSLKSKLVIWKDRSFYTEVPIPNMLRPEVILQTDASNIGWGAKVTWPDGSVEFLKGTWSGINLQDHINVKELNGVYLSMLEIQHKLQNNVIKIFSDNKVTVRWLEKGASKRSQRALEILTLLTNFKNLCSLDFIPTYLKGCDNRIPDALSRSKDNSPELVLCPATYKKICLKAKVSPEIDLFASHLNTKCRKFFSAEWDPKGLGIDALACSWDKYKTLYGFPPSNLINKVLFKFSKSNSKHLLLIVPRSKEKWHRNLKALQPKLIPYSLSRKDFILQQKGTTNNEAPAPLDYLAYLVS